MEIYISSCLYTYTVIYFDTNNKFRTGRSSEKEQLVKHSSIIVNWNSTSNDH